MTTMSYKIRRGDTFDIECARTGHRLGATWKILETFGVKREMVHGTGVINEGAYGKHLCSDACRAKSLPEWVTDEIIQDAYNLADAMQTARGVHNQLEGYRAKMAR